MTFIDPEQWLVSTFRTLKDYVLAGLDTDTYEIVGSFAEADALAQKVPLVKTIIEFEIDDIANMPLGFGEGVLDWTEDNPNKQVTHEYWMFHQINFGVGIWASDETGGVTARLRAYQRLADLFSGNDAIRKLRDLTKIEIRYFRNGHFTMETVNDVRFYRVVDTELVVRVPGKKVEQPLPYIDTATQDPELVIQGSVTEEVITDP